jgi:hypothetical protein
MYRPASSDVGTASTLIVFVSSAPPGPGIADTPVLSIGSELLPDEQAPSAASDIVITKRYVSLLIRFGWPMRIELTP